MLAELRAAVVLFVVLTLITGVAYPLAVTLVAQAAFPEQARGSLVRVDGRVVGSKLIGQPFDDPKYFWSRPSATSPMPFNGGASSGSNVAATNPKLVEDVGARVERLRAADPGNDARVPVDLVTASASGLDPHISPAAAVYQAPRVARVRGVSLERVTNLVNEHIEHRALHILGEPRVNVLELNLALDALR